MRPGNGAGTCLWRPAVEKYVYEFSEGNRDLKDLLGGKGANLAEMTNIGLPVPPGFTITTDACRIYMKTTKLPPELRVQVTMQLRRLEDSLGRLLGAVSYTHLTLPT